MMTIDSQLILILSALGSINGFLVALYLWRQQPKTLANQFLAIMLVMVGIRTLKSVLFYFNPEITKTILQVGLSSCILIGPLLYFFCLSHLNQLNKLSIPWKAHLAALISTIVIVGFLYPYQQYEKMWGGIFYKVINYIWLFYIVLSAKALFPKFKSILLTKTFLREDIWLLSIFSGNALIWLAYFTASYTSYIVGALSFSFVMLIIILLFVFKPSQTPTSKKYADKKIEQDEADTLIERLSALMSNEEIYKNSLVTMPQIAKRIGVSSPRLSQLLNDNLNKSFSQFINEFRIEAAKAMLSENKPQKTEVIAELCGFNSQSTFYSVFKKLTSKTPADFKASNTPKL